MDHLLNNNHWRLAGMLLRMACLGEECKPEAVIPKVTQETLAKMIGTTRSRVSFFMSKFRQIWLRPLRTDHTGIGGEQRTGVQKGDAR